MTLSTHNWEGTRPFIEPRHFPVPLHRAYSVSHSTNSMRKLLSLSWSRNFPSFKGHGSSKPLSQQTANGAHPELDDSSLHFHTLVYVKLKSNLAVSLQTVHRRQIILSDFLAFFSPSWRMPGHCLKYFYFSLSCTYIYH